MEGDLSGVWKNGKLLAGILHAVNPEAFSSSSKQKKMTTSTVMEHLESMVGARDMPKGMVDPLLLSKTSLKLRNAYLALLRRAIADKSNRLNVVVSRDDNVEHPSPSFHFPYCPPHTSPSSYSGF